MAKLKTQQMLLAVALAIPLVLSGMNAATAVTPAPSPPDAPSSVPGQVSATALPSPTASVPAPTPSTAPVSPSAPAAAPGSGGSASETQAVPAAPGSASPGSSPTELKRGQARMGQAGLKAAEGPTGQGTKVPTQQGLTTEAGEPSVPEQPAGTAGQPLGLDVSSWQGTVNWSDVKNKGARFAYVKATEGVSYRSGTYSAQYSGAASVGLLRGAYHFALPDESDGATQARFFVNNGGGWSADGITMPPALDIEDNPYAGLGKCYGMSPAQLATWVRDFTRTVYQMTNKQAMIYTGYYFWRDCLGNTSEFSSSNPLWLASYWTDSPAIPGGWSTYSIWQYANDYANSAQTVKATFPGDQNVFNGTMDQLRRLASTPDIYPIGLIPGATILSGKWGGNGRSYTGWFKDGYWCLQMPVAPRRCFGYGMPGDKPVVGDWNGNGNAGIGIVRNGVWWLVDDINTMAISHVVGFGVGTDTPIVGDWNGAGRDSIGIWRNSSFQVSYDISRPVVNEHSAFGVPSDTPIIGDWDGNGRTGIGVWRNGQWWLSNSVQAPSVATMFVFGIGSDRPVTGDWNGDRTTTVGIVRGNSWQLTNNLQTKTVDISYF